jgi:hypothetical protein
MGMLATWVLLRAFIYSSTNISTGRYERESFQFRDTNDLSLTPAPEDTDI